MTNAPHDFEQENMILRNKVAELQALIDSRPPINSAIVENYIEWTGKCNLVQWLNVLDRQTW